MTVLGRLDLQNVIHFGLIFRLLGQQSGGFNWKKIHRRHVWRSFIFSDVAGQQFSTLQKMTLPR